MIKKVAFFLSVVLHPLIVPTFIFYFILFHSKIDFKGLDKLSFFILIFLTTYLLLGLLILTLRSLKIIPSVQMHKREDRRIPMLVTFGFMLILVTVVTLLYPEYFVFTITLVMISLSILILLVVTEFWKISVHASGIAGVLGTVTYLFLYQNSISLSFYFLILLISVLLMLSRWILGAHNVLQIVSGFLVGFILSISSATIFVG